MFGETDISNPFVPVEQMMPFVPFVRAKNFEQAVSMAKEAEHGFRHTAIIHSAQRAEHDQDGSRDGCDAVREERPLHGVLGLGGEGYLSFSIAGPTGEGVTTPLTFTRERRCSMIDSLWILVVEGIGNFRLSKQRVGL